ncbi:hypothetical protein ANANG_G00125060 [Anguilla anguilla]|uniref:Uncharacterized protein n=1 Tax=Anguilla anguilla TaxID=7936 RepID=A0A9D3RXY8_ANGAN|nr:hypothetical protein ANANG_G00125060 [Anguilla anguilla]
MQPPACKVVMLTCNADWGKALMKPKYFQSIFCLLSTCLEEDELTDAANVDFSENEHIIGAFEFEPGQ